jgi:hypothetical protein
MEATVRERHVGDSHVTASPDFWRLDEENLDELFLLLPLTDAPPDWESAWNSIRVQTADALNAIRNELRSALDDAPCGDGGQPEQQELLSLAGHGRRRTPEQITEMVLAGVGDANRR